MSYEADRFKESVKAAPEPVRSLDILREKTSRSLRRLESAPEMQRSSVLPEAAPIQRCNSMEIRDEDRTRVIQKDVENAYKDIKESKRRTRELHKKADILSKKIEQANNEKKSLDAIFQYINEKKLNLLFGVPVYKSEFNYFIENQTKEVFKDWQIQDATQSDTQSQEKISRTSPLTDFMRETSAKLEKLTATRLTYDHLIKMEKHISRKIKLNDQLKEQFQDQLKKLTESDIPLAQKILEANRQEYQSLEKTATPTILDLMKISKLRDKIHRLTKEIDALADAYLKEGVNDSAPQPSTSQPDVSLCAPSITAKFWLRVSPTPTTAATTDKAMSLIADWAQARADLLHLRSLSPLFEQQVDQACEGDQQSDTDKDMLRLRELSRIYYVTQILFDQLGIRLATNQKSLNEVIRLQEKVQRTPPSIEGIHQIREQYLKVNDWRNKLLNVKNKLTDISDPAQSDQRMYIDEFRPNNQQIISLQKIEGELKAQQVDVEQYLENLHALKDNYASYNRIHDKYNKMVKQYYTIEKRIKEYLTNIDAQKRKVERNLQLLEQGDLDQATKQAYELWDKLPKDHPFFPWYLQGKYETSRKTYSSDLLGSCLVSATMGTLDTLGTNMSTITDKDVAKLVRLQENKGGAYLTFVPAVIKKYAGENYSYGCMGTISELKGIVKRAAGKPVIVCITSSTAGAHAIIADAIEQDEDGLRRICIRDSLSNSYRDHSYSLLLEDFEKKWTHEYIAPTKSLHWPHQHVVGSIVATTLLKPIAFIKNQF